MTVERNIPATGLEWLKHGRRIVAATLVATDGSAPLDPGATMLVDDQSHIEGSVTGGCVEAALFEEARDVLAGGLPRLRTYGISDSQAAGVGLMCGGVVHIFVHELRADDIEVLDALVMGIELGIDSAVAMILDGPGAGCKVALVGDRFVGGFGLGERFDMAVENDLAGRLRDGATVIRRFGAGGQALGDELRVFVQSFASPPHMICFGAIDFSLAIARVAKVLGYFVTICDARPAFVASAERRFRVADEVVIAWPDQYLADRNLDARDVVLVFTHDAKFDEPALRAALQTDAGYVGALGSRQTHADRVSRLLDGGLEPSELQRISAPCGLDIGARTPEETAISILAEIIAKSAGRRGGPLTEGNGRIHASSPLSEPA